MCLRQCKQFHVARRGRQLGIQLVLRSTGPPHIPAMVLLKKTYAGMRDPLRSSCFSRPHGLGQRVHLLGIFIHAKICMSTLSGLCNAAAKCTGSIAGYDRTWQSIS